MTCLRRRVIASSCAFLLPPSLHGDPASTDLPIKPLRLIAHHINYSSDFNTTGEILQVDIDEWFQLNSGLKWGDDLSTGSSCLPPDEYNDDMDHIFHDVVVSGDPLSFIYAEYDWQAMFRSRDAPIIGSIRTNLDSTINVIPNSPTSFSSEKSADDPSDPADVDTKASATAPVSTDQLGFTFGPRVTSSSFASLEETLPAHSSDVGLPGCGQQQQQHPFEAVEVAVSLDVSILEKPRAKRPADDDDGKEPAKRPRQSTEKKFICPVCSSGWSRKFNLNVHVEAVHENIRAHTCSVSGCSRAFSRKHDMKRHYQSEHTDQGSPRCKGPKA
ncbi:hypothetical protein C8Q79DRAFT_508957 [Trametes meyenii]|nr:hypothetical protein C8Q79DRAFT_508957 [Trametes meyenii]